jgi:TolB-like protein/Flp pilus assembly protein TadD
MKKCPQCGREYDTSMMFCLDDGAELLYGPAASDEPRTAILHETASPGEATTPAHIHTTEQTVFLPSGNTEVPKTRGFDKRLLLTPVALVVILFSGFLGYRYFSVSGQIGSIAVMPFVNETGNADVEYLAEGMTETLIKGLSNIPDLSVKPRSTVFRYKGKDTDLNTLARELNVQAILNGRVTQRGDQLTLSVELIDVLNDKVIWTEQYLRRQADVVNLQSEIAKEVSTRIKAKLTGVEEEKVTGTGTTDAEAYQAYLKGRYLWNRRTAANIRRALEQFSIATERDPNYALAFVGLADCYLVLSEYAGTSTSETLPKAKANAERALALDGQLAEAYATLGLVAENNWQWAEADQHFERALSMNPHYATAYHWNSIRMRNRGRYDEALAMIVRAHELDPLSSVIAVNVARTHQIRKNDQAAVEILLKLIESDPGFASGHSNLGLSYLRQGRKDEAVTAAERAVELSNRSGIALGDLGYVYFSVGKTAEALAIAKELETRYSQKEASALHVATAYGGSGDSDKVFEWLEKAYQERNGQFASIRLMHQFDGVRDDPRLNNLLKRINLPE